MFWFWSRGNISKDLFLKSLALVGGIVIYKYSSPKFSHAMSRCVYLHYLLSLGPCFLWPAQARKSFLYPCVPPSERVPVRPPSPPPPPPLRAERGKRWISCQNRTRIGGIGKREATEGQLAPSKLGVKARGTNGTMAPFNVQGTHEKAEGEGGPGLPPAPCRWLASSGTREEFNFFFFFLNKRGFRERCPRGEAGEDVGSPPRGAGRLWCSELM